jgi:hypothetical protein
LVIFEMIFSRRRLLRLALAAPAILTLPHLAEATCTPTGLGPSFTPPDSLPSVTTLPNPFALNNGTAITTKVQWLQRRAELKQAIQYYMMGHAPPPSPVTVVNTTDSTITATNGTMTKRVVNLTTAPGDALPFSMNLYIPTSGAPRFPGPYPVLMGSDMSWSPVADPPNANEDAAIGVDIVQTLVARGYIIAEFGRDAFSLDSNDFPRNPKAIFSPPVYTLYPFDYNGVTGFDWGMHRAQAWGFSRCIDYLMTLSFVDKSKIAVAGHSRGGVAATLAGIFDERIAVTCANQAGIGSLYRYTDPGGGPTIDNQVAQMGAPGWYNQRLASFVGNSQSAAGSTNLLTGPVDKLPFDWHQAIGLIAPRGFITNNGLNVVGIGPLATTQAFVAAQEIWKALGVGTRNTGTFYSNINTYGAFGGHEFTYIYWKSFVDFMDFVFFNIALPPDGTDALRSHSYIIPYVGLTKPYGWSTPALT